VASNSSRNQSADGLRVACPHCGIRVMVRTLVDLSRSEFKAILKERRINELESEQQIWGKVTDDRKILKNCMKGGWVHLRVNGQHRLAYFRGKGQNA
jgi:DNA-directed RNA polymerase subunit RPC12/RpoP